jgi:hypothetical protein
MLVEILQTSAQPSQGLKGFFPAIALVCAIVSYMRRKEEIGGWFLYFYYWMFVALYVYWEDFHKHIKIFLPSSRLDEGHHLALIIAVFPRLLGLTAVVAILLILIKRRDWVWIQRLRLIFGVTVLISMISVAIDVKYFRAALLVNATRLIMLCVWFVYLCVSARIRKVFRTKDWLSPATKVPLVLGQLGNP